MAEKNGTGKSPPRNIGPPQPYERRPTPICLWYQHTSLVIKVHIRPLVLKNHPLSLVNVSCGRSELSDARPARPARPQRELDPVEDLPVHRLLHEEPVERKPQARSGPFWRKQAGEKAGEIRVTKLLPPGFLTPRDLFGVGTTLFEVVLKDNQKEHQKQTSPQSARLLD